MVEEVKRIADGIHRGQIVQVRFRKKPDYQYEYTDLVIEFEDGFKISASYPTKVTLESKLGKLMLEFKAQLEVGKPINVADVFVGRSVEFMTITEQKAKGSFPKVVAGSLRCIG